MRKLFNKPWFVGLLALAAVVFVARTFVSGSASAPPASVVAAAEAPADPSIPAAPLAGPRLTIREALAQLVTPGRLRDPFVLDRGPVVKDSAEKTVVLPDLTESVTVSAVWVQANTTYVLVNSHVYKIGDQIGRLTLESANREGVWLRHWKGRDFVAVGSAFTLATPVSQAAVLSQPRES